MIRWHRRGFRAYWHWKSGWRGGRPKIDREVRHLIRRMSRENPLWGAPRIHGSKFSAATGRNEDWAIQRRPILEAFLNQLLYDLSASLGNREYLEDRFSAGVLLMTTVLRIARQQPLVEQYGNLFAYKERCEARPAFQRALRAEMQDFERDAPPTADPGRTARISNECRAKGVGE